MLAGVLLHGVQAAWPVDAARDLCAGLQRGVGGVGDGRAVGVYVGHVGRAEGAEVAGLAAALREEGGFIQHDRIAALGGCAGKHRGGKLLYICVSFV